MDDNVVENHWKLPFWIVLICLFIFFGFLCEEYEKNYKQLSPDPCVLRNEKLNLRRFMKQNRTIEKYVYSDEYLKMKCGDNFTKEECASILIDTVCFGKSSSYFYGLLHVDVPSCIGEFKFYTSCVFKHGV